jgi:hypothetical protein
MCPRVRRLSCRFPETAHKAPLGSGRRGHLMSFRSIWRMAIHMQIAKKIAR